MRIFKKLSKILTTFFLVDQIDFPSSPKALKRRCFGQIFCAAGKFLKKQVKKQFFVFGHFLETLDARSPSKLVYIGAKGVLRKILGSVGQKWISYKVPKGGPLGRQGVVPEGGGSVCHIFLPLNPPLQARHFFCF